MVKTQDLSGCETAKKKLCNSNRAWDSRFDGKTVGNTVLNINIAITHGERGPQMQTHVHCMMKRQRKYEKDTRNLYHKKNMGSRLDL